jgi:hypothetical protein
MVRTFADLPGRAGIDESWSRLTPAQAKAAGLAFVIGYVSEDTTGKNLTAAEARGYLAAGLEVLLAYEYATDAVHGGAAQGTHDANVAVPRARALGYPPGSALAFAVDEDLSADPAAVDGYARAFTAACHGAGYRSMDYGGYDTVKRCADLRLTDLHWQTYTWSGGRWDARAAIRQVQNDVVVAGVTVDRDTAMTSDIGAWRGDDMAAYQSGPWSGGYLSDGATGWPVAGLIARLLTVPEGAGLTGKPQNAGSVFDADVAAAVTAYKARLFGPGQGDVVGPGTWHSLCGWWEGTYLSHDQHALVARQDTARLQGWLRLLGADTEMNGMFGPKTDAAVRVYNPAGVVGPGTAVAIETAVRGLT